MFANKNIYVKNINAEKRDLVEIFVKPLLTKIHKKYK